MYLQIAIVLFLAFSFSGLVMWWFNVNNSMGRIHKQNISILESAIYNNRKQIDFRNSNLNRYDFFKYNLDEALVVQQEIKIYNT